MQQLERRAAARSVLPATRSRMRPTACSLAGPAATGPQPQRVCPRAATGSPRASSTGGGLASLAPAAAALRCCTATPRCRVGQRRQYAPAIAATAPRDPAPDAPREQKAQAPGSGRPGASGAAADEGRPGGHSGLRAQSTSGTSALFREIDIAGHRAALLLHARDGGGKGGAAAAEFGASAEELQGLLIRLASLSDQAATMCEAAAAALDQVRI